MFPRATHSKVSLSVVIAGVLATSVLIAAQPKPPEVDRSKWPKEVLLSETPPEQSFIFLKGPGKPIHVKFSGGYLERENLHEDKIVKTMFGDYVWHKVKITDQPDGGTYIGWEYLGLARKPGEVILTAFESQSPPNFTLFNCTIAAAPFLCYFLGIIIRKVVFPGNKAPPLGHQFLLGIPVSLVVVSPLLLVIDKTVTDLPAFLVTMGIVMEHGMLLNETATYHLKHRLGELRRASSQRAINTKANKP